MAKSRWSAVLLVLNVLGSSFCIPVDVLRLKRGFGGRLDSMDRQAKTFSLADYGNEQDIFGAPKIQNVKAPLYQAITLPQVPSFSYEETKKEYEVSSISNDDDDDDDDFEFETMQTSPSADTGSSIISLLNLANALSPVSGDGDQNIFGAPEIQIDEAPLNPATTLPPTPPSSNEETKKVSSTSNDDDDDDDDDFEFDTMQTSPSAGTGSSIISLLNLASALFSGSSGGDPYRTPDSNGGILWPLLSLKVDIFRAILKFGTSLLSVASATSST